MRRKRVLHCCKSKGDWLLTTVTAYLIFDHSYFWQLQIFLLLWETGPPRLPMLRSFWWCTHWGIINATTEAHTAERGKGSKVKDACRTVLNSKGLAALHQADTLGRRVTFIHSSDAWCCPPVCWVLTARSLCTHGKPPWTHMPESVAHSPRDKKPWDSTGLILDPVPSTVVTVCKWRRKKAVSFMT